ncbi:MAG: hypothetical protein KBS89_00465, partial [Bacteroidales bacterium]|nr:hypothetical protein [Candidatus Egerieousia equi]
VILNDPIFHDGNELPCEDQQLTKTRQDVPAEALTRVQALRQIANNEFSVVGICSQIFDFQINKFISFSFTLPMIRRNFAKKNDDENNCYSINEDHGP